MSIKTTIKRRAERAIYLGRGERSEQYTLISHPPGTGDLISHPPGTGDLSSGLSGPGAAVTKNGSISLETARNEEFGDLPRGISSSPEGNLQPL